MFEKNTTLCLQGLLLTKKIATSSFRFFLFWSISIYNSHALTEMPFFGPMVIYAAGFSPSVTWVTPEAVDVASSAWLFAHTKLGNFFSKACLYFGWLKKIHQSIQKGELKYLIIPYAVHNGIVTGISFGEQRAPNSGQRWDFAASKDAREIDD